MDNIYIIVIAIVICVGISTGIIVAVLRKKPENNVDDNSLKLMLDVITNLKTEVQKGNIQNREEIQSRLDKINDQLVSGISHSSKTMQEQFRQSSDIIKEVTTKLSKLDETNKQILDFSGQLQSLENILKNPKHRGILGEYFLESLLSQILPPSQYKMQYKFRNGDIVDSVIYINDKVIPIDAKFSLEKYNSLMEEKSKSKREEIEKSFKMDIKNRIDETSKYIRIGEDTTDFAIMFIPAEGIFYNLLIYKTGSVNVNTQDLIEYAFSKRVMITSPTSFFAYLQTILQGLKSLKIEQSVKEIVKNIHKLGKHLNSYESYLEKLGNNLGTTVNMYNSAYREFEKLDKDVYKLTDGNIGGEVDPMLIEKPSDEK